jgi:hypothetical protein
MNVMGKKSILLAIILFSATSAHAEDDGIVRMRSDGKMIDAFGKITAVPNMKDSRNNEFKRYYQSLDAKGRPVANSDYYIINDPLKGLVKISVNAPQIATPAAAAQTQNQVQKEGMVTRYTGSQTLIKSPDAPIYNDVNNDIKTVY